MLINREILQNLLLWNEYGGGCYKMKKLLDIRKLFVTWIMIKKIFIPILFLSILLSQTNVNQSIKDSTKELNDILDLPLKIDQYTTLLNINGDDGMVTYYYLMDNDLYEDYNISRSQWKENQTLVIKNFYCRDPSMEFFRENNVKMVSIYLESDGSHKHEIISKYKCN